MIIMMTVSECFDAWKTAMSSTDEREFFNYALENSIIKNIAYIGKFGRFNPSTQTLVLPSGSVIYVTPNYRAKLMLFMFHNLNVFD